MAAAGSAAFHSCLPSVQLGYPVIAFAALMLFLIPALGDWFVEWRGGVPIPREARTRRYLDQLGAFTFRPPGALGHGSSRRAPHRGLFRDSV